MEATSACEIARLPEELISAALSLTTPLDACRAAAVCRDFRAAADSDAVWSCFVPRDLPPLAHGELSGAALASEKGRFLRLSDRPVLLADHRMCMWLDRETGAKCYMLSARALHISWGSMSRYWRWIPLPKSCRFPQAAELLDVCWLEIRGKIDSKTFSQDSAYVAYIVFKIADESYGLDYPAAEASVAIAGSTSTHNVLFQTYNDLESDEDEDEDELPLLPHKRVDCWMELKLGEFHIKEGDDGVVSISLMETIGGRWKKGLIVQGIEIRGKKR